MNRIFISVSCLTGFATIASIVVALVQKQSSFLLLFVNSMFYMALPCILAGGFLFLLERGFFNVTHFAFRKMFKLTQAGRTIFVEEKEKLAGDRDMLYRTYSFQFTYPLLLTGITLAVFSMIISLVVLV